MKLCLVSELSKNEMSAVCDLTLALDPGFLLKFSEIARIGQNRPNQNYVSERLAPNVLNFINLP